MAYGFEARSLRRDELAAAIEALLFASDSPLTVDRMREILNEVMGAQNGSAVSDEDVVAALDLLRRRHEESVSGIDLQEVAGGYQLTTKPRYAAYVGRLFKTKTPGLSQAALETLAIVAYRQPITRAEIDMLRGVNSERAVATLIERDLIREVGRKQVAGRPILYGTTREFLRYFGLKDINDLPPLPEDTPSELGFGATRE